MFSYVAAIFKDSGVFTGTSNLLASFLYSKSTHARVKDGELYIALLNNVPFGTEYVQALSIIKSETKETFLKVFPHGQSLEVISEEGIDINKPDKGCLIFNRGMQDGFTVCVLDTTNRQNDTQYWIKDFLQVEPNADSYHNTDKALGMCRLFIANEYAEKFAVSKGDQIDLLNRSMDYFKTNDQFSLEGFTQEVMHHPEVIETFTEYKKTFESARNYAIEDEFDINLSAVKKQAKAFKSIIKLDKNFHIYVHGRQDLLQKGYDEQTGKHYYKIYFDEES